MSLSGLRHQKPRAAPASRSAIRQMALLRIPPQPVSAAASLLAASAFSPPRNASCRRVLPPQWIAASISTALRMTSCHVLLLRCCTAFCIVPHSLVRGGIWNRRTLYILNTPRAWSRRHSCTLGMPKPTLPRSRASTVCDRHWRRVLLCNNITIMTLPDPMDKRPPLRL